MWLAAACFVALENVVTPGYYALADVAAGYRASELFDLYVDDSLDASTQTAKLDFVADDRRGTACQTDISCDGNCSLDVTHAPAQLIVAGVSNACAARSFSCLGQ